MNPADDQLRRRMADALRVLSAMRSSTADLFRHFGLTAERVTDEVLQCLGDAPRTND